MESFPFSEVTKALGSKFSKPAKTPRYAPKHQMELSRAHSTSQLPVATFYRGLSPSQTTDADSQPDSHEQPARTTELPVHTNVLVLQAGLWTPETQTNRSSQTWL